MTEYIYNISDFPNDKVSSDRLNLEIHSSAITISLDHIDTNSLLAMIYFKTDLSISEKEILDTIIANHSGETLPESALITQVKIAVEQPKYIEAGNVTQELFCAESLAVDISAGVGTTIKDFSWPFNIGLKSATFQVSEDMVGDELVVKVAPNTIIGALTSNLNAGDSSMYVNSTVIQNIKYGQYIGLYASSHELGRVIAIGPNYLTFQPVSDVSANAGSYVSMCAKIIPYVYFNAAGKIEIGKTVTTANRIPANTKIRVEYKNNTGTAKKISFFIEYLY
jgi:hypothetical protein